METDKGLSFESRTDVQLRMETKPNFTQFADDSKAIFSDAFAFSPEQVFVEVEAPLTYDSDAFLNKAPAASDNK